MSFLTVAAAVAMFFAAQLWKWRVFTRRWGRLIVNPKAVRFPNVCPMCLRPNPDTEVSEKSIERQTGYYVVASKVEFWRASVLYCVECSARLTRSQIAGWSVGAVCVGIAFLLSPPTQASLVVFCYILFGYPAFLVATTIKRGVVLGAATSETMCVFIRRPEYLHQMAALNSAR